MASRNGKHKDGNVRIGVYLTPERKALAVYLANKVNKTMTDIIWEGILMFAKDMHILTADGNVAPEHRVAIATAVEIIKATNKVKG